MLPIDRMSKSIFVATANPYNRQALDELKKMGKGRPVIYIAPPTDLIKVIGKVFR